jgi:hypothetical protein
MSDFDLTLSDSELIGEVRDSLAGLGSGKVPDDTITQTTERFVVPLLNDAIRDKKSQTQEDFNSAVIAWTAELSFDAWLAFTRLRDREVESYINPDEYRKRLENRTNLALQLVDATKPPEIPNQVVTIKHDGANRTVNLQKVWHRTE